MGALPLKINRWRNDFREYEAACWIVELVGEAQRILNIGPSWGRDFYALLEQGKWVVNLDIAPQPHLPMTGRCQSGLAFSCAFLLMIYRGGWIRLPRLVHAIRKVLSSFGFEKAQYQILVAMDCWWGEQRWANGVYILAYEGEVWDWRRVNVEEFRLCTSP